MQPLSQGYEQLLFCGDLHFSIRSKNEFFELTLPLPPPQRWWLVNMTFLSDHCMQLLAKKFNLTPLPPSVFKWFLQKTIVFLH